ncbi:conjugative transposon TraK protein [Algoriphagus ratkowskyi]|uniref:Conjugative transposon TraK protein n=1 Tax=Algoriphagus ratkowskyi TaxID=57028 RepID=A0A2W7RJZ7_9BACT|nr:conjugative transposon protein TraK [Algoriphagus ratkowskyi]PZX59336.1 conjugative transposon TraK protein [Algoriphagus ratkowskyi]TXD77398.1 conjugative transposon protein TraK [Algoriphagus ratkowskyi]
MFQNLRNLDTAFRHVKYLSFVAILGSLCLSGYLGMKAIHATEAAQERIYILAEGKALEAFSATKKQNIPVEARDHVKMFHHYFFTLSPDENFIRDQLTKSLYMADGSAKKVYDNLQERGYFSEIVSANMNQEIQMDSVAISMDSYPFGFRYYGKQKIIRPTSVVIRNLITTGRLRHIDRTDKNPHGFLIENWETLSNENLSIEKR